jgi:hypothetical protein
MFTSSSSRVRRAPWYGLEALFALLLVQHSPAVADECPTAEVNAHVADQYSIYGPQSRAREYFGFIYLMDGDIRSAVVRGANCANIWACSVGTRGAAELIPKGAKVLGEWHTHPQASGSRVLSRSDVRGALSNHNIPCYTAYYSTPSGQVFAWDPRSTSVHIAMESRTYLGNYGAWLAGHVGQYAGKR